MKGCNTKRIYDAILDLLRQDPKRFSNVEIAKTRGEEHLVVRRGGDAVGAGAARRVEYRHRACFGIEPTIDAVLPGEPEHALAIKARGVEVGVAPFLGQREELDCTGRGIDPGDRVLPT